MFWFIFQIKQLNWTRDYLRLNEYLFLKSGSSILLYIEEKQTFMTWNCKAVVLEDLQGAQRLLSKESRMASSHQLLQKWNFASHL